MIENIYKAYKSCGSISTDTRKNVEGSVFFGLRGENFNGSKYAVEAIDKGASYAVVDDENYANHDNIFLVDNSIKALQQIANKHRKSLDIPVIGITGSNGKTTTKELINAILSKKYLTHFTSGNYNNHIGLPLTILSCDAETEVLILEMGASAVGEILELCSIGEPTHGIITNISPAHLKGFGDLDGVKRAKSELYDYLRENDGTVFVNLNEKYLYDLSEGISERIFYSLDKQVNRKARYLYQLIQEFPFLKLKGLDKSKRNYKIPGLFSYYNAMNAITAISVGKYFDVKEDSIVQALESFKPYKNRSEIISAGQYKFLMDAYNANPVSMKNGIEAFAQMESSIQKVLVLGDMKEMGQKSIEYHQSIIDFLPSHDWAEIYLVGTEFSKCRLKEGMQHFDTTRELEEHFKENNMQPSFIMLKGSRSMELERIKDILI